MERTHPGGPPIPSNHDPASVAPLNVVTRALEIDPAHTVRDAPNGFTWWAAVMHAPTAVTPRSSPAPLPSPLIAERAADLAPRDRAPAKGVMRMVPSLPARRQLPVPGSSRARRSTRP